MTALPPNAVADLERAVADLERQLQSARAENDRLERELGIARDRQGASADILRTIASAPGDAGRSLQQIAEACARLFGAPGASILLAEDGEWGQSYRFGDSARRIRSAVPLSEMRVDGPNLPGKVVAGQVDFHDGRGRAAEGDVAAPEPQPITREEYDRLVTEMEENSRRTADEAQKRAHTADAAAEAAVKAAAKAIRGRRAGTGRRR